MTNLRVYENSRGSLAIEVSSPILRSSHALFAPALYVEGDPSVALGDINPAEVVAVPFRYGYLQVAFVALSSMARKDVARSWEAVGTLEETDSINILNHIRDILAWP